ncbi:MAG TPA: glycogen debranching protein GlgX [Burkholderiaceae bacterium]|nr:glycogen debranching protein GlgX [Burkholderiaceae bacterium]
MNIGPLETGRPWPLGAHCVEGGVNFAVFSGHADAIELCLFDAAGERETARLPMPGRSGDIWHGYLPDAGAGLVYALRAHGRWQPELGHRFDPDKWLLDPYAREIVGGLDWRRDRAHALKARVIDEPAPAADPPRPRTPLADTVLYEAHVKGLTMLHAGVPEKLRGTYAGLASDAVIAHLQRLGVTAISLLPVHQHLDEERLAAHGLTNYWGYNTVGFFAVEPRYASSAAPRDEFRAMVRALHAAGIEVILDVVYNHTAETDAAGPTISWRGLDNLAYYRTLPGQPGVLDNPTGCGNALNLGHPRVLQMVMDSLRYWAQQMEVDGFRFDLAPVLARGDEGFDARAAFLQCVAQDPVLAGVKLIAEPWDIGPGGYQLGAFPPGWLEWNDRFRDATRRYWLAGESSRGEFAQRLCASSDTFQARGRAPAASVNFIAAHDGFTLRDLLTYEQKRNAANGENNRDGSDTNHGWNCGAEGETADPEVLARRDLLQRALLATLLFAQGTPMLCSGDELGHSQDGNNNAYCQDNATTWIAWQSADEDLIAFTAGVLALRRGLRPLPAHWASGEPDAQGVVELAWFDLDGRALDASAWRDPQARTLGALIGAAGGADGAARPLLLLLNAEREARQFALPDGVWTVRLDSANAAHSALRVRGGNRLTLSAHSLVLLAAAGGTKAAAR